MYLLTGRGRRFDGIGAVSGGGGGTRLLLDYDEPHSARGGFKSNRVSSRVDDRFPIPEASSEDFCTAVLVPLQRYRYYFLPTEKVGNSGANILTVSHWCGKRQYFSGFPVIKDSATDSVY